MQEILYDKNIEFSLFIDRIANINNFMDMINKLKKNTPYKIDDVLVNDYHNFLLDCSQKYNFIEKNIINTYFNKTRYFSILLFYLAHNNIELDKLNRSIFLEYLNYYFEIEITYETKESDLIKMIKDISKNPENDIDIIKSASLILSALQDEEVLISFIRDINKLKKRFENELLIAYKNKIYEAHNKYQNLINKNPQLFYKNINIFQVDSDINKMQIYFSYFAPFICTIYLKSKIVIFGNNILEQIEENDETYSILLCKFLSEPKRFKIIQLLSEKKYYSNELAKELNLTPATMNYHINKLYELKLINIDAGKQNKLFIELNKARLDYLLNNIRNSLLNF